MTKSLKAIQVFAKIGKVLSTIIFIFCIVGVVGCAIGAISIAAIPEGIKVDGVTIHSLIEAKSDLSIPTIVAACIIGIIGCLGEGVVAKFGQKYFKHELEAGTPFTFEGAKEFRRLGILSAAISLGVDVIFSTGLNIAKEYYDISENLISGHTGIGLGIAIIVVSVIFTYGAETLARAEKND